MATVRATPDPFPGVPLSRPRPLVRAFPRPRRRARLPSDTRPSLFPKSQKSHEAASGFRIRAQSRSAETVDFPFTSSSNATDRRPTDAKKRFPPKKKKNRRRTSGFRPRPGFCPASPASAARIATRRPRLYGATVRTAPRRCATRAACATTAGTPKLAARRAPDRASPSQASRRPLRA